MSVVMLDDVRPDVPDQLRLEIETFEAVRGLADAGAITTTALVLDDPALPYDTASALAAFLGQMSRSSQWWIGDLLVFAEGVYGERMAQIAAETGLSEQTLLRRMHVCKNVPRERRIAALSFSTHALVANLSAAEQKAWLKRAAKHGWNAAELRANMKAARKDERPQLPVDDDDTGTVLGGLLEEVARAIVRDAREHDDQFVLIPVEDLVRLKAALGQEEG